jgi:hypothetical protein
MLKAVPEVTVMSCAADCKQAMLHSKITSIGVVFFMMYYKKSNKNKLKGFYF